MFSKIDADLSNGIVYYDGKLKVDAVLIQKILLDLNKESNYFNQSTLRAYVDANGNVLAVDIREKY